jgi:hypothetical protein
LTRTPVALIKGAEHLDQLQKSRFPKWPEPAGTGSVFVQLTGRRAILHETSEF